uniref:Uncharacterized protein n=1 Tax=Magallana gigas TaxID=29159 RepID=K1Q218_MAGGI
MMNYDSSLLTQTQDPVALEMAALESGAYDHEEPSYMSKEDFGIITTTQEGILNTLQVSDVMHSNSTKRRIVTLSDGNAAIGVKLGGELVDSIVAVGSTVVVTCVHVDIYQEKRSLNSSGSTEVKEKEYDKMRMIEILTFLWAGTITAVYPKKYLGVDQLTATAVSKCQFLSDQNFPEMVDEDLQIFQNDEDFFNSVSDLQALTDILDIDIYDVCAKDACREKKMLKDKCPICGGKDKKNERNIRVTFLYSTESKQDERSIVFKNTLREIMKDNFNIESKSACLSALLEKLPIKFKCYITAKNSFYNISQL